MIRKLPHFVYRVGDTFEVYSNGCIDVYATADYYPFPGTIPRSASMLVKQGIAEWVEEEKETKPEKIEEIMTSDQIVNPSQLGDKLDELIEAVNYLLDKVK